MSVRNRAARSVWPGLLLVSFAAGDKVRVTLNPIRTGEPGGIFVSVTLADGQVLGGRAGDDHAGGAAPPPTPAPR